jgi:hypothetical protein
MLVETFVLFLYVCPAPTTTYLLLNENALDTFWKKHVEDIFLVV